MNVPSSQDRQPSPHPTVTPPSQPNFSKKLRFITNSTLPQKRRRIGAACLTCRKRKTACSGERPVCDTCRQNKLECAGYSADFGQSPAKRRDADNAARSAVVQASALAQDGSEDHQVVPRRPVDDCSHAQASQVISSTSKHSTQRSSSGTLLPGQQIFKTPEDALSNASNGGSRATLFSANRNRMPYFRWLGPTAIMPGFKQMVVKVKRPDTDMGRSSTDGNTLQHSAFHGNSINDGKVPSMYSGTPVAAESDVRTPLSLPFYDTNLSMPPSELITHLANTFFTHLGCNYPFLQRERFLKDLEEKQVDAILVDAVCALAARFSTHPLLTQQTGDENKAATPAEYGHAFAQRAKIALTDTFACPSVAAAQAALLLAYNEFGESRDSGLWMYLGISIRIAQDLGMHTMQGLKYCGRDGPTPRMVKTAGSSGNALVPKSSQIQTPSRRDLEQEATTDEANSRLQEQIAVEQERCDTFWAIFFLDRMISSGTGRRCTLRDKDIELGFPSLEEMDSKSGWPAAFPALIRIVHLYGRVADLLNGIKAPSDITLETPKRLAVMEAQVTSFYQGLPSMLHFDAVNFQHYVRAGEGTNFVLLHFWFHVLIILLHRPTLLKTFEGRMLQLFPNSQQLSMSSAKTIADILSYSQLIDAKASLGNPFTTQPIYIAACAFLKETVEQTASSTTQSRSNSPARKSFSEPSSNGTPQSAKKASTSSSSNSTSNPPGPDAKAMQRHTLLATAASQHYQLCHKALQSLETYWAGTKYILTVLEQKFEGVRDPLLYTTEEGESAMEQPRPEPAFTSPGWRRKLSWERYLQSNAMGVQSPFLRAKSLAEQTPGSPVTQLDPSKAIGWTLTGTMDSGSTNLAWHYAGADSQTQGQNQKAGVRVDQPGFQERGRPIMEGANSSQPLSTGNAPALHLYSRVPNEVSHSEGSLLLGLNSPADYQAGTSGHHQPTSDMVRYHTPSAQTMSEYAPSPNDIDWTLVGGQFYQANPSNFGDMTIESQDIDMSMLGLDMMPWFDSFPPEQAGDPVLGVFDPHAGHVDTQSGTQQQRG